VGEESDMNPDNINPNTGVEWNQTDWYWENPKNTFYGLRSPQTPAKRVMFFVDGMNDAVLVIYCNVLDSKFPKKMVCRDSVRSFEEARHLWECLTHPTTNYVRDDSVPPRLAEPPTVTSIRMNYHDNIKVDPTEHYNYESMKRDYESAKEKIIKACCKDYKLEYKKNYNYALDA